MRALAALRFFAAHLFVENEPAKVPLYLAHLVRLRRRDGTEQPLG